MASTTIGDVETDGSSGGSALDTKAPPPATRVVRLLKALKRLQLEKTKLEVKFHKEKFQLEMEYHLAYAPLFEKRAEIVNGRYEPTDSECQWDLNSDSEKRKNEKKNPKMNEKKENKENNKETKGDKKEESEKGKVEESKLPDDVKGIPDFWLTVFKNDLILSQVIQEHDEPILKHLTDVKVAFLEKEPMGFLLMFYFSPNEYFTNEVLTRQYEMKCGPDEEDPFSFKCFGIYRSKGCTIDWKEGQNVTVKVVKKQMRSDSGVERTVVEAEQQDSFFEFFSPPALPADPEAAVDYETFEDVMMDFEIGEYIRASIVPHALLYYMCGGHQADFEDEMSSENEEEGGGAKTTIQEKKIQRKSTTFPPSGWHRIP